jgi:hypothetical protein
MFKIFALFLITIVKLNVAQIPSTSTSLNVPKTTIANANQTPPTTTAQLGKCAYNIDAEIVATTARNQTAGSFGQCCSLCLSDPQCVAWTYVVKTNECQIKKDLPLTRSSVTRCYGCNLKKSFFLNKKKVNLLKFLFLSLLRIWLSISILSTIPISVPLLLLCTCLSISISSSSSYHNTNHYNNHNNCAHNKISCLLCREQCQLSRCRYHWHKC